MFILSPKKINAIYELDKNTKKKIVRHSFQAFFIGFFPIVLYTISLFGKTCSHYDAQL